MQAEDNANNKGRRDDCCAEGGPAVAVQCVAELAKNMMLSCGSRESEETRRAELRETALEFSDLLETVNREIHLLDKVTVYFQSFFSTLEGLCTVKKIGKLKADKVMLAAKDLFSRQILQCLPFACKRKLPRYIAKQKIIHLDLLPKLMTAVQLLCLRRKYTKGTAVYEKERRGISLSIVNCQLNSVSLN